MKNNLYYSYSEYLKETYQEKIYKLPINLPVSCPNRTGIKKGCFFCAAQGTGFEACSEILSVTEQLTCARKKIEKKYNAHKFIAYFQNYTNTFLSIETFRAYIEEAASFPDIVEIAISTRPDCIREDYLQILQNISETYQIHITIELGLQTVNYHTLQAIGRGHGLAEFIDGVLQIKNFNFALCVHVILNLPGDEMIDVIETAKFLSALKIEMVKIHSLYIAKNSILCDLYENGIINICSKDEYLERLIVFLEYLSPEIAIERLFSRIPEDDAVFCNWGVSWWKLKSELEALMLERDSYQGKQYDYLNGAALKLL